ncbi:S-layer homology domain-containing protein [Patescibacteria group bacterium]
MRKLAKLLSPVVGVILVATLLISNGASVFATPASPAQEDPTTCVDCQTHQDDYDAAYADLGSIITDVETQVTNMEGLLEVVDPVTAMEGLAFVSTGTTCEDSATVLPYWSSFNYDGSVYCFADETQYNDFFGFFSPLDPLTTTDWEDVMNVLLDLITDADTDADDIEDLLDLLDALIVLILECEDTNCPAAVECPDCETIANDLDTALDDLAALELEADILDAELTDLETEIDGIYEQLADWAQLKADFEQMVEDAGGQHGADCEDFEPASGQAWGIAHNFGNVEWCFTNEGQIEDMIQNLDDYWQTHSSEQLPSEEALNAELDTLLNDYFDALTEYFDVLDLIEDKNLEIDLLAVELEECLAELQALQDAGECLDQDIAAMQAVLDEANGVTPFVPEPVPAEEPPSEGPEDAAGHWAEDFIDELFNADIVSGDSETGMFRPDDEIKRGEASKIVTLGNGDATPDCDSFFDVFVDVDMADWFCPYVDAAQELGYFNGYPDGTFGPDLSILRGESAAVVLRVLGFEVPEYDTYSFPDITGDEWYANEAEKAYQCGIFSGRDVEGEKHFEGGSTITRAEFAKIVDVAIYNDLAESDCADYVAPEAV